MRTWWWLHPKNAGVVATGSLLLALGLAFHPIVLRADRGSSAITFTDRGGVPLGTVLTRTNERTIHVPLDRVAPVFVRALVAIEDRRYFRHGSVDVAALARAAVELVRNRKIVSGGSTIAMQTARLRSGLPRTLAGKLEEIVLAARIDAGTNKAAILEDYMNRLPMGDDLTGVEAGSRAYFGVPAIDLDLAQAAFLVALPNDPIRLDPYRHRDALEVRRRLILDRLAEDGVVSAQAAAQAKEEKLSLLPPGGGISAAHHLLFRLAAQLPDNTTTLRTTIDGDLQRYVEANVAQVVAALAERNVHDAAALVVENRTGAILAYVGSPAYLDTAARGRNDGVTALRQPGSTLKPFLYERAFERRTIRPTTILADVPTVYALPGRKTYAPLDYSASFAGPVRARIALANSLNVPAVRVLSQLGVPDFLMRLHDLGFTHLQHDADYYGLGLTLGSGEITLEELAHAYTIAANGGRSVTLHARADVSERPNPEPIGDAATWTLLTDMLADAPARARAFGVNSLLRLPFASAVKTGTSSDFRDTWTVGYTRDYTVAIWVGNFDGSPMRRVSGVTGAAPLWNRIMLHLYESREPPPFARPQGYVLAPMCAATGRTPDRACSARVTELVDAVDRAVLATAAARLGPEYDTWLSHQPQSAATDLRIVMPRDGDVFLASPDASIVVDVRGAGEDLAWSINGRQIPHHETRFVYPLERGFWTIAATSRGRSSHVRIHVGSGPLHRSVQGFTIR